MRTQALHVSSCMILSSFAGKYILLAKHCMIVLGCLALISFYKPSTIVQCLVNRDIYWEMSLVGKTLYDSTLSFTSYKFLSVS